MKNIVVMTKKIVLTIPQTSRLVTQFEVVVASRVKMVVVSKSLCHFVKVVTGQKV